MHNDETKELISNLEKSLANDLNSYQQKLMAQVNHHIHASNEPVVDDLSLQETLELLLIDIEGKHPKSAMITREIIKTLSDIGI